MSSEEELIYETEQLLLPEEDRDCTECKGSQMSWRKESVKQVYDRCKACDGTGSYTIQSFIKLSQLSTSMLNLVYKTPKVLSSVRSIWDCGRAQMPKTWVEV